MARLSGILILALLLVALGAPLALKKIERNGVYGFRTKYTMTAPEVEWFRVNQVAGVGMCVAGMLTAAFCVMVTRTHMSQGRAYALSLTFFLCAMGIAVGIAFARQFR